MTETSSEKLSISPCVPTLGGIPLVESLQSPCSGAAFTLDREPEEDIIRTVDDWAIETRPGMKCVVARGGTGQGYETTIEAALSHAQKGLDLICMRLGDAWSIEEPSGSHLVWWPDAAGLVIRWVSIAQRTTRVRVTMTVTDPQGNVRPEAPEAPLPWHESFRYFRISQGSEDLFDAYRNAFLALESILSTIFPPLIRGGKVSGGESKWLKEAIAQVGSNGVLLSDFVPVGVADPVDYLHRELYQQTRCGLNHAKGGLPFLIPRSQADRGRVTEDLERLARLYLRLVELQFKVTRPASVITDYGFKSIFTRIFDEMNLLVSDDEKVLERTDEAVNPMGGAILELRMAEPVDATTPYLVTRMFWAERSLLATLPFIRRIGGCMAEGTPFILSSTQGRLVLGNARRFEVLLGITGTNFGQPKTSFTF